MPAGRWWGLPTQAAATDHAFLYSNGTMADLGTLPGGSVSAAHGINASGQVVGYADTSSGYAHAFLYSNGTMTDLGTLPGGSCRVRQSASMPVGRWWGTPTQAAATTTPSSTAMGR